MDVSLVVTHDCNLACHYCYMGASRPHAMPAEVADRALDLAFADGARQVEVAFFGGEPFLAFALVQNVVRSASTRAAAAGVTVRFVVTTNGTLLDDERIAWLRENRVYVGLSIDGDRAAHDAARRRRGGTSSFDATCEGLDRILRAGLPFETISVVSPTTVRFLADSIRFLMGAGVTTLSLNPDYGAAWEDADLAVWQAQLERVAEAWLEAYERGRPVEVNVVDDKVRLRIKGGYELRDACGFGRGEVAVAPSGRIYPCERLVAEDRDATWVMGDVFRGFVQTAEDMERARAPSDAGSCGGCALKHRCMRSCVCANLADRGCAARPGGIVCFHEQACIDAADRVAERLFAARNPHFLRRFYPGGVRA